MLDNYIYLLYNGSIIGSNKGGNYYEERKRNCIV